MLSRLFIIAITPTIALGTAIYLTDRYDKEPPALLFKVFFLGALSVIPVAIVEKLLLGFNIFPGLLGIAYMSFIVAGFTEEYFKRAVVLYGAFNNRHFNEKLDGIVYCVFSALGFATIENIMYVVYRFSGNPYVGIMRGLLSVPAHVLFGVTMGYYLSLAKFTDDQQLKSKFFRRSLFVPIVLHGIFNFILMAKVTVLMLLFIPFVIYLWKINLVRLNKYASYSRKDNEIIKKDKDE